MPSSEPGNHLDTQRAIDLAYQHLGHDDEETVFAVLETTLHRAKELVEEHRELIVELAGLPSKAKRLPGPNVHRFLRGMDRLRGR